MKHFFIHIAVLALGVTLAASSCTSTGGPVPGEDIFALMENCRGGSLDGVDLNSFSEAALTEEFLQKFEERRGYPFTEAKAVLDTLPDEAVKFLGPRLIFDYRQEIIENWLEQNPDAKAAAPPNEGTGKSVAIVYTTADLVWKCTGLSEGQNASEKIYERLSEKGYKLDFISAKALRETSVRFGKLLAGPGYGTVVVPECKSMPLEDYKALLDIASKGVTVLFETDMPGDVPGVSKETDLKKELYALEDELTFTNEYNILYVKHGKGHVVVSKDAFLALYAMGLKGKFKNS